MAVADFDTIVDIIEEDIALGWMRIQARIRNKISVSDRDIDAYFKVIDPEGKTVKKYHDFRRICRAMNEFKRGDATLDKLAEKYNFDDGSHLSKEIKKKLGKSPTDLLDKGYECPKHQHLADIMRDSGIMLMPNEDNAIEAKEQIINSMKLNEEKYKSELISAIDKIIALQNENDKLKAVIRRDQIREQIDDKPLNMSIFSNEMYEEFQEIERCRSIYDFNSEDIINLYHESVRTGKNLEELCIEVVDDYVFEEPEPYDYALEKLAYRIEYEGDLDDIRREYFEDDDSADCEDDPYAVKDCEHVPDTYGQYEDEYSEIDYEDKFIGLDEDYEFEETTSQRTSMSYGYWKKIKNQIKQETIKNDSYKKSDEDIFF